MRKKIEHKIIDNIEYKKCGHCKQWLPLDCFHNNKSKWDGLACECKLCKGRNHNKRITEHRKENKIELKHCSSCKEWKILNEFHKSKNTWDNLNCRCKKCVSEQQKNSYIKHSEKRKKYSKQYRLKYPELKKQGIKNWRVKNTKYLKQYKKQYNIEHRKENTEQHKLWKSNNRDKCCASEAKRNAQKQKAISKNTNLKEIQFLYTICSEWNAEKLNGFSYHVDHIQPLSKGGLHHEDNLQILPAFVNLEKKDKWPLSAEEKIRYKGFRI